MLFVVQRTFYALGDTRTPFLFTLFQVVVFTARCARLPRCCPRLLAVGIALVTTIACIAQLIVASLLLRRRLGTLDGAAHRRRPRSATFAALVLPLVAGVGLLVLLGGTERGRIRGIRRSLGAIVSMAVIGVVMAVGSTSASCGCSARPSSAASPNRCSRRFGRG